VPAIKTDRKPSSGVDGAAAVQCDFCIDPRRHHSAAQIREGRRRVERADPRWYWMRFSNRERQSCRPCRRLTPPQPQCGLNRQLGLTDDVCRRVHPGRKSWQLDSFDAAGVRVTTSSSPPLTTFASSFNLCGPGNSRVLAQSDACAAPCISLGAGRTSGSVQISFTATDDENRTVTFSSPRVTLSR
jgi:hypothetical protein